MSEVIKQNKLFALYTALVILLVLIAIFAPYFWASEHNRQLLNGDLC